MLRAHLLPPWVKKWHAGCCFWATGAPSSYTLYFCLRGFCVTRCPSTLTLPLTPNAPSTIRVNSCVSTFPSCLWARAILFYSLKNYILKNHTVFPEPRSFKRGVDLRNVGGERQKERGRRGRLTAAAPATALQSENSTAIYL